MVADKTAVFGGTDLNNAAFGRELNRIAQQVTNHCPKRFAVSGDEESLRLDVERDRFDIRYRLHGCHGLFDESAQIEPHGVYGALAAMELHDLLQVSKQVKQTVTTGQELS